MVELANIFVRLAECCEPGDEELVDSSDELEDCENLEETGAYLLKTDPRIRSAGLKGCRGDTEVLLTLESRSKNSLALRKRETRLADLVRPVARAGASSVVDEFSSRLESLPPLDREPPPELTFSLSSLKLTRMD